MTDLKCVYTFNEDEQFFTINFLQDSGEADDSPDIPGVLLYLTKFGATLSIRRLPFQI